jgi:predicted permease
MIARLADLVLRVTVPHGEFGDWIRADLAREAEDLSRRSSDRRVALWRLLEGLKLVPHIIARRLWGASRSSSESSHRSSPGGSGSSRPNGPGPGLLAGISEDVRYAMRRLTKAPLMTGVAVAVAGIGIGASTATFSVLDAVLLRPLPYPDAGQLVQITQKTSPDRLAAGRSLRIDAPVNAQDFLVYQAGTSSFSSMAWASPYEERAATVGGGDGPPQTVEAMSVSPSFFTTLGAILPLGRAFLPEEIRENGRPPDARIPLWTNVLIISDRLWSSRFGSDPDIIGKSIVFEGGPSTVVGVTPPGFRFPPLSSRGVVIEKDVDVFLPLIYPAFTQSRNSLHFQVIARMKPGVEVEDAQVDVSRIFARMAIEYPESHSRLVPVVTPLHDLLVRDYGLAFFSLMGMVGLVLLVACANIASLVLAQGTRRRAELALRAAIGGGRARLFRLLMAESLILASLGGVLGLLLARWGTTALIALVPAELTRAADAGLDGRVLTFALVLSLATGILFGLIPALRSSDVDLAHDLKGGGRPGTGVGWSPLGRSLITGQVALTLVLLIGGGLLGKSFLRLRTTDLGYDHENVLTVTIHRGYQDVFSRVRVFDLALRQTRWSASIEIMERIRALPGVRSVASGNIQIDGTGFLPMQFRPYRVEDQGEIPSDEIVNSYVTLVSPEYFGTVGIPLVRGDGLPAWNGAGDAGRYWWASDGPDCNLEAKESGDRRLGNEYEYCVGPEVLVSETFAATAWPDEDPIGKELGLYGCCWTVAGVVADVNSRGVDAEAMRGRIGREPMLRVYVPYTALGPYLVKTDLDPLSLVAPVRDIIADVDGGGP